MKLSVNNFQQKNVLSTNTKNKQTQMNFNALNNSHRQNPRVLPLALGGLTALGLMTGCGEENMQQVSTQAAQPQATQPQTAAVAQPSTSGQLSDKNQIKTGELLPQDLSQLGTVSFTPGNNNVPLNQQVQIQGGPVYCIGNLSTPQDGSLTGFAGKNASGQIRTYIATGISPQGQTCTPGTFVQNPILGTADGSNKFSDGSTPVSFYEYTPTNVPSESVSATEQQTPGQETKAETNQPNQQTQAVQPNTGSSLLDRIKNGEQFQFNGLTGLPQFRHSLSGDNPATMNLPKGSTVTVTGAKLGYIGGSSDPSNGSYVAYQDANGRRLVITGCAEISGRTPNSIVDASNGIQALCMADDTDVNPQSGSREERIYLFNPQGRRVPVDYVHTAAVPDTQVLVPDTRVVTPAVPDTRVVTPARIAAPDTRVVAPAARPVAPPDTVVVSEYPDAVVVTPAPRPIAPPDTRVVSP